MAFPFSINFHSESIIQARNVSYVYKLNCYLVNGNYNMKLVNQILNQDPSAFNPDKRSLLIRTPICIALRCSASKDTIQQLLEAGCSANSCTKHKSVLHCASAHTETRFNTDVLTMLIQDGAKWKENDRHGQSPLCYALRRTTDKRFVNLLFSKGCQFNSCMKHKAAVICLMNRDPGVLLTADVVKLLSQAGADTYLQNNKEYCILLDLALRSGVYETPAIEAILDLVEAHPSSFFWTESAICNTIKNPHCQVSAIDLLIQRGASVTLTGVKGFTPLHLVVSMPICCPQLIKLLANNNRTKNFLNCFRKTPLQLCLENNKDENIAVLMFVAGCRLNTSNVYHYVEFCMNNSKMPKFQEPKMVHLLKMLLKFGFLERPEFENHIFLKSTCVPHLFEHAKACKLEISNMKAITISQGLTLYDFVVPKLNILQDPIITSRMRAVNLNHLLKAMSRYNFNIFIYLDIIAAYFPMSVFKDTLEEMWVYLGSLDLLPNGKKVILNWPIVLQLCDYLLPGDALRLILAYKPYVPSI